MVLSALWLGHYRSASAVAGPVSAKHLAAAQRGGAYPELVGAAKKEKLQVFTGERSVDTVLYQPPHQTDQHESREHGASEEDESGHPLAWELFRQSTRKSLRHGPPIVGKGWGRSATRLRSPLSGPDRC